MNCKTCRDEIDELEGGQPLSPRAGAHLESCPSCVAFREERLALREMIRGLEVVSAPANFDFRLRSRLAELKGRNSGHVATSWFAPSGWAITVAASIVILIAVGVVIKQVRNTGPANGGTTSITKVTPDSNIVPTTTIREAGTSDSSHAAPSTELTTRETVATERRMPLKRANDPSPRVLALKENPDEGGGSVDSAVSTAANVMPIGISDPTLTRSVIALPVHTSSPGASISLIDGNTKPQAMVLRAVTFGGQDVFEQTNSKKAPVSVARGVW